MTDSPFPLFQTWFEEARQREPNNAEAMALATLGRDGLPNIRMVLLKSYDSRGFVFYTNGESTKGEELAHRPVAALNFYWKSLQRQIRIRGLIEEVSSEEADAYFASRPRDSQIGAWASAQSRPLEGRFELEKRIVSYSLQFGVKPIPRPPYWKGFRLLPLALEFWQERPFRLHERILFSRASLTDPWESKFLYP